nr:hypothetical protein BaRGS_017342 [Batillaria attramentaria]
MASAFLLANVTHRRFGINMTLPCDVIDYYVPNDVNWNISESEILGKSYRVINNVGHNAFHDSLLKIDFEKTYPEDVIFLRTNVEHFWAIRSNPNFKTTLPQWAKHGRPKFFRDAWNMLMKPAEHLTDHLERFTGKLTSDGGEFQADSDVKLIVPKNAIPPGKKITCVRGVV